MVHELGSKVRAWSNLRWRTWGEESVVFNPQSGDTHLLDAAASQGLRCLESQALDRDQLCRELAGRLDIELDHPLEQYVERLLVQLDDLGLLETCDS